MDGGMGGEDQSDSWLQFTKIQSELFLTTFPDILLPTHAHFFISSSYMNHVKHDVTTLNVAPFCFFK